MNKEYVEWLEGNIKSLIEESDYLTEQVNKNYPVDSGYFRVVLELLKSYSDSLEKYEECCNGE